MDTCIKRVMIVVISALMLIVAKPVSLQAGWVNGDEALGGISYLLECAYHNKVPTGLYADWYYRAYHQFHYEISLDEESRAILERIVEAEATGGTVEQKMNVASCVLVRVQSKKWPSTVKGVVFDNDGTTWQFTPVSDGRYYTVKVTEDTKEAVERVSKNGLTHSCDFFCSYESYTKEGSWHRKHLEYGFEDGIHIYCY